MITQEQLTPYLSPIRKESGPHATIYIGRKSADKTAKIFTHSHRDPREAKLTPYQAPSLENIRMDNCLFVGNHFYSILISVHVDDGLWEVHPKECFQATKTHTQAKIDERTQADSSPVISLHITYDWMRPWLDKNINEDNLQANFMRAFVTDFYDSDFSQMRSTLAPEKLACENYIAQGMNHLPTTIYQSTYSDIVIDLESDNIDQISRMVSKLTCYYCRIYLVDAPDRLKRMKRFGLKGTDFEVPVQILQESDLVPIIIQPIPPHTMDTHRTTGTRPLECPVIAVSDWEINKRLAPYFQEGCIALPATEAIIEDCRAHQLRFLVVRGCFYARKAYQRVYTATLVIPTDRERGHTSWSIERLRDFGIELAQKHQYDTFLYVPSGQTPQYLDAQGNQLAISIIQLGAKRLAHLCKLYGQESFTTYYLNKHPLGVSSAFMRRGEIYQRFDR